MTVEQTDVMFQSQDDGQIRKAAISSRVEGVPIAAIVAHPSFTQLTVRDATGAEHTFSQDEAAGALLVQLRGHVTLVLPNRGRSQWRTNVIEIQTH